MVDFCKAVPLSNKDIQQIVKKCKMRFSINEYEYVDVIDILENKLYEICPSYSLEIVEKEKMPGTHGLTIPETNEIIIREDVYEGALNGNGRDRFTIMHEIFHFLFHRGKILVVILDLLDLKNLFQYIVTLNGKQTHLLVHF